MYTPSRSKTGILGKRSLGLLIAFSFTLASASAQWLDQKDRHAPRTKDGKPNLTAAAPRMNGKPDLSGLWEVESTSRKELSTLFPPPFGLLPGGENGLGEDDPNKYFLNILADYKFGEEPFTPEAGAAFRKTMQNRRDPGSLCTPLAVPIIDLEPAPSKFVQTPGLLMMLSEADTTFRQVFTDGRKLPQDPQPSFLGYSAGRWEGDTLVVETVGLNDVSPMDAMGHTHSTDMRVTERFHRRDYGHMDLEITMNDPKTFARPVTIKVAERLLPDTDLLESFCVENEKDATHFK